MSRFDDLYPYTTPDQPAPVARWAKVTRVIDGDTVNARVYQGWRWLPPGFASSEERIRLAYIDTPERGQAYYQEATDWLRAHAEGQWVRLRCQMDADGNFLRGSRDRVLGILHRPLWMGSLNWWLVWMGYARPYQSPDIIDEETYDAIQTAASWAKFNERRVWRDLTGLSAREIVQMIVIGLLCFLAGSLTTAALVAWP